MCRSYSNIPKAIFYLLKGDYNQVKVLGLGFRGCHEFIGRVH